MISIRLLELVFQGLDADLGVLVNLIAHFLEDFLRDTKLGKLLQGELSLAPHLVEVGQVAVHYSPTPIDLCELSCEIRPGQVHTDNSWTDRCYSSKILVGERVLGWSMLPNRWQSLGFTTALFKNALARVDLALVVRSHGID